MGFAHSRRLNGIRPRLAGSALSAAVSHTWAGAMATDGKGVDGGAVEPGAPPATARAPAKTVLIVEDNELNMKLFRDLLAAYGYATIETRNGMEALSIARSRRPDLILMDIQLPEVSGLEVTKWLKDDEDLCHIPVVAVTAFAMRGDEQRIRQGGCEAYLSKPISIALFVETVRRFIGEPVAA
jgi:two-component system cell cycle response regulator DivK